MYVGGMENNFTVKGYFSGMSGSFMFPMCITPQYNRIF